MRNIEKKKEQETIEDIYIYIYIYIYIKKIGTIEAWALYLKTSQMNLENILENI